jgi:DNA-binding NarL/FixJ family response regulator
VQTRLSGYSWQATENWARAVKLYRSSLDLYRQSLQAREWRRASTLPEPAPPRTPIPAAASADDGAVGLSPREREVARLIARGYTNQQIARELVVTRGTAANHVAHILTKLGLANRTQAAAYLVSGVASRPGASAVADTWIEDSIRKVS